LKGKIAIIDLGSNSVRMNIIKITKSGGYFVFDSAKEMVRLSEGLHRTGHLNQAPMDRTISALKYFKGLTEVHGVTEIHALSTAAVRMANNKDVFLKRVKDEVGFNFKILSGYEEAYYDYLGVVNSMDCNHHLMIDIGGGSTEIGLIEDRRLVESISIPIGSVILTEMFGHIKNRKKRIKEAKAYVKDQIKAIDFIKAKSGLPIVGLGGTIRAIGKVDKYINDYPLKDLHNYHLTIDEVRHVTHIIIGAKDGEVGNIEGISKKRADVMTMGIMPLIGLMDFVEAKELRISGNGLRNGYFYEKYFESMNQDVLVKDVLESSYTNIMKRFSVNESHARHVQKLALSLFDQLADVHHFNKNERKTLEIAALLHDVGLHVEYHDHHIHGLYLLLYVRLFGLSIKDHLRVAFLVGNHRENGLKNRLDEYNTLFSKGELRSIKNLSIFLQMAEQLDRSVKGNIKDIKVDLLDDEVLIKVIADEEPRLEIKAGEQYKASFYRAYGYDYKIVF